MCNAEPTEPEQPLETGPEFPGPHARGPHARVEVAVRAADAVAKMSAVDVIPERPTVLRRPGPGAGVVKPA